ncbi:hypothetical protein [Dysgonomonas sp. GY617]|uniref:hypothetical protein n=1 Tax=Dysgonomonas sp. GY617 TaxID=2780420 RepID=UPI0018838086|nr:hypothetical protein [Dysgonomonas sp. GY617]MBF0577152.1 hypothetical protein [Dysgonomonas sp. GY617]
MRILVLMALMLLVCRAQAQVGVNTENPMATIDVVATKTDNTTAEGIIAPRLKRSEVIAKDAKYTTDQTGTIVYVTDVSGTITPKTANIDKIGYYYFDGVLWQPFTSTSGGSTNDWTLTGNAGTSPSTNFLGTTDNTDLVFKTNATGRMIVSASGNVGIETSSPHSSASLDLNATNKGFLMPRVALNSIDDAITIPSPATGLQVFNTALSSGLTQNAIYYNSGTELAPIWTLLQPYTATEGVSVKKILYTTPLGVAPDLGHYVEIGPYRFSMDASGPQIGMRVPLATSTSLTALIYQVWDEKPTLANTTTTSSYDMTSVTMPANDITSWVSFGIGGVSATTGEQNEIKLTDPVTGKIYEIKFLLLQQAPNNHYGILASEY